MTTLSPNVYWFGLSMVWITWATLVGCLVGHALKSWID